MIEIILGVIALSLIAAIVTFFVGLAYDGLEVQQAFSTAVAAFFVAVVLIVLFVIIGEWIRTTP